MPLPPYTGPFQVGAIDLEIPVRRPRPFGASVVANDRINVPRGSHSWRRKAGKRGHTHQVPQGKEPQSEGLASTAEGTQHQAEEGADETKGAYGPLRGGSKTSTLYMSTVLFTVYYPSSINEQEAKKYDRVAWLGRPKRKGVSALFSYVGQYGPMAVPASPAIFSLAAAKMTARCAPPLASTDDPRVSVPPPFARTETGMFGDEPARFPLVIFSHGLAGNRLAYSQFCGELASYGAVVAAVEHRDGSGVRSSVRFPLGQGEKEEDAEQGKDEAQRVQRDGPAQGSALTTKNPGKTEHHPHANRLLGRRTASYQPKSDVPYLVFEAVGMRSFAPKPTEDEMGLRQAQLAMRNAELNECLHVLKRIERGEGEQVARESTRGLANKLSTGAAKREKQRRVGKQPSYTAGSLEEAIDGLAAWKGKLDVDKPALMGHSFGGAAVLESSRMAPENETPNGTSADQQSMPPWLLTIVLDPWVEPVVEDGGKPNSVPTFCINTEAFSVWQEHFEKLKRIMSAARQANGENRGFLLTVCATNHLDVSDYPFLLPHLFRSTVGPHAAVRLFSRAAYVEIGLSRQRYRERANDPGFKFRVVAGKDPKMGAGQKPTDDKHHAHKAEGALQHVADSDGAHLHAEHTVIPPDLPNAAPPKDALEEPRDRADALEGAAVKARMQPEGNDIGLAEQRGRARILDKLMHPSRPSSGSSRSQNVANHRQRDSQTGSPASSRPHSNAGGSEHQHPHLVGGVVAKRSDSGNGLLGIPRTSADESDFVTSAHELVDVDRDVEAVQAAVEDISAIQSYKHPKIHSLLGLLFRMKGVRPGLSTPGSVLVHSIP
ncbi:Phospholipase A2 (platelet-activating factor acetylhydrolase in humans) [Ceraceosorus bombacis]|uniref:1-alkyl-2-acetylglycerophosphocholine esterase n=1 Tax=Ceraceosorus bombacis TaxID=401625 RepID=A0A0P1BTS4_9BASI|nr:Phospholipase A2 (platelet-activating factor acetylhydrolase in humans) [Ceraceosorus bombacis]